MIIATRAAGDDLATLMNLGAVGLLTDAELLSRFASGRANAATEAAFAALVRRHGPMVLGVCRRVVGEPHGAEDAYQAVFLVLARKAPSVRLEGSLGPWLHGVSLRVARRARDRAHAERTQLRSLPRIEPSHKVHASDPLSLEELKAAIDAEVARLPGSYRAAVVLCDLEGLTQERAAGLLGCPVGTVQSRLHRARKRLRSGLARRGLAPASLGLAALASASARAEVPTSLVEATVAAASRLAAGGAMAGSVSPSVENLARQVLRSTLMSRIGWTSLGLIALGLAGAGLLASPTDATQEARPNDPPEARAEARAAEEDDRLIEGVVLDPIGQPAAGATVVVGLTGTGKPNHRTMVADEWGRFSCILPFGNKNFFLAAHRAGLTPASWTGYISPKERARRFELRLDVPEPFSAVLIDGQGQPVAEARVRVVMFAFRSEAPVDGGRGNRVDVGYGYLFREVLDGSPLESLCQATTDRNGAFSLPASPGPWLKLDAQAADGACLRVAAEAKGAPPGRDILGEEGFVTARPEAPTRLVAFPTARIAGRVASTMSGVGVVGLKVTLQQSRGAEGRNANTNLGVGPVLTGDDGRFTIDGLDEGTVNVLVHGEGEGESWTYHAGQDVALRPLVTTEVAIELIPGVAVEGTVATRSGAPAPGVMVGIHGPSRPRSGVMVDVATTDALGHYRRRLPSGETLFYVMGGSPEFVARPDEGSSRTLTIPECGATFAVPPLEVDPTVAMHGRVVDARGEAVANAVIVGVLRWTGQEFSPGAAPAGVADDAGAFRLSGRDHLIAPGQPAMLLVRRPDGRESRVLVTPNSDGEAWVKLPEG